MRTTGDESERDALSPRAARALRVYLETGSMPEACKSVRASRSTGHKWSKAPAWRRAVRVHVQGLAVVRMAANETAFSKARAYLVDRMEHGAPDEAMKAATVLFGKLVGTAAEQEISNRIRALLKRVRDLEDKIARRDAVSAGKVTQMRARGV